MRQSDLDATLKDVCPDQIEAFRAFAADGDMDVAASIHFERCLICERTLDALVKLREQAKPAAPRLRDRIAALVVLVVVLAVAVAVITGVAYLAARDRATMTAAERTASRLRYVRMPGRPETCVATLPGNGGFGPTFVGAAPCTRVHDRVEFDEDASYRLGRFTVVRIEDTLECLALDPDDAATFTFPCAVDDD